MSLYISCVHAGAYVGVPFGAAGWLKQRAGAHQLHPEHAEIHVPCSRTLRTSRGTPVEHEVCRKVARSHSTQNLVASGACGSRKLTGHRQISVWSNKYCDIYHYANPKYSCKRKKCKRAVGGRSASREQMLFWHVELVVSSCCMDVALSAAANAPRARGSGALRTKRAKRGDCSDFVLY